MLASLAAGPMLAAPAFAQAAKPAPYSVTDTLVGKLIDDPAAAAVLQKLILAVWANEMFQSAGRELTLKGVQQPASREPLSGSAGNDSDGALDHPLRPSVWTSNCLRLPT